MRDVSELTGFPEIMDGRVKTLHPTVHGGLLGVRDDPEHAAAMRRARHRADRPRRHQSLSVRGGARSPARDYAAIVENIDIGGPAMVRAAAKNHAYVAVVTDPADYAAVLDALEHEVGSLSLRVPPEAGGQGLRPHRRL